MIFAMVFLILFGAFVFIAVFGGLMMVGGVVAVWQQITGSNTARKRAAELYLSDPSKYARFKKYAEELTSPKQ